MKIKLFCGIPAKVETEINAWLPKYGKGSKYKIEKISMSSAMYVNPHSGDDEHAICVMIELRIL